LGMPHALSQTLDGRADAQQTGHRRLRRGELSTLLE
jgi:hypothetical protein